MKSVALSLLSYDKTSGGYASYARALTKGLLFCNETIKIDLIANSEWNDDGELYYTPYINTKVVKTPSGRIKKYLFEQIYHAKKRNVKDYDLIHMPFSNPLIKCNKPFIVTMHDVIPLLKDEMISLKSKIFNSVVWNLSIRNATAIITVSEYSKKDLVEILGVEEDKIHVVHAACPDNYYTFEENNEIANLILRKYGIVEPYILFVGRLEKRKNVPKIIEVFNILKDCGNRDLHLVLVGKDSTGSEEIYKKIKNSAFKDHIHVINHINYIDLPYIYNKASVFVFPSLYEGFGLPPIEAMASGTPVVVSNRSSLPEVVGDAAVIVDPTDTEEMYHAVSDILTKNELRDTLIQKGKQRATMFTSYAMAKKTLEVYKKVMEQI